MSNSPSLFYFNDLVHAEQVIYDMTEAAALLRIPVVEVKPILERVLLHVKGDE